MPLDISTSIAFVKDRTEKTTAAQNAVATTWVWPGKTVAQWQADLLDLDGVRDGTDPGTTASLANLALAADKALANKSGLLGTRLDTLHAKTVQAVGIMRARTLANPEHRPVVDELSARGDSQRAIEDEGGELLAGWKLDFGTDFEPAPGNTYTALRELFEGSATVPTLRQLKSDVKDARALARKATGKLNLLLSRLEDECVQWYGEAILVFGAGTPEGDMIRGTIPTSDQYAPGTTTPTSATSSSTTKPTP
jgi:hypothetical protein